MKALSLSRSLSLSRALALSLSHSLSLSPSPSLSLSPSPSPSLSLSLPLPLSGVRASEILCALWLSRRRSRPQVYGFDTARARMRFECVAGREQHGTFAFLRVSPGESRRGRAAAGAATAGPVTVTRNALSGVSLRTWNASLSLGMRCQQDSEYIHRGGDSECVFCNGRGRTAGGTGLLVGPWLHLVAANRAVTAPRTSGVAAANRPELRSQELRPAC